MLPIRCDLYAGARQKSKFDFVCLEPSQSNVPNLTEEHLKSLISQLHVSHAQLNSPTSISAVSKVSLLSRQSNTQYYISELLQVYTPSINLRSSSMLLLIKPKSRHSQGDRSFSSAAPRIWNSLPLNLRSCRCTTAFKSLLKTYLMSQVFKD